VYVGSSAGSMVIGKRLSGEAHRVIYGEEITYGTEHFLEFIDQAIMPHLDSPHFPNREETLLKAAKNYNGTVYGLKDDSAVVVNGDEQKVIGSPPVTITDGKLVAEGSKS
jgi:hypothetical protein